MSKDAPINDNSSLTNFQFDDEDTFFGISPNESSDDNIETIIEEIKKDDELSDKGEDGKTSKKDTEEDTPKDPKEEEEDDFFPEEDGKTDSDTEDENEDEPEDPEVSSAAKFLQEANIFEHVELDPKEPLTKETLTELIDEEVEGRVSETFEAFFDELDEEGKQFLDFKRKGGNTKDWLGTIPKNYPLETLDVEKEDEVDTALRYYIRNHEGLEGSELEDKITWLKEKGKDRLYAQKYHNEIVEESKKARQELLEKQAELQKKKTEKAEAFRNELQQLAQESSEINGITLTKGEQRELTNYILKPTVKVGKNKFVAEFQIKLAKILKAETAEDKKNLLLLAKLAKDDFKLSDIEKNVQTAVVKKIKKKIESDKSVVKNSSSGSRNRSLADHFN